MKEKIVQKENKVLRQTAEEVPANEIGSKKIERVISAMKQALSATSHGVALAAPQIGRSLRIFIADDSQVRKTEGGQEPVYSVYINPKITRYSKKTAMLSEGCLSVDQIYGVVKRSEKVNFEATDETGKKIKRGASGLLAQIVQHEVDHLNGIIFTDKAVNLVRVPHENEKQS